MMYFYMICLTSLSSLLLLAESRLPCPFSLFGVIHPIHRLKLSDWLKEGHMTWIIFDNVHVWKLIHVCYLLLFP